MNIFYRPESIFARTFNEVGSLYGVASTAQKWSTTGKMKRGRPEIGIYLALTGEHEMRKAKTFQQCCMKTAAVLCVRGRSIVHSVLSPAEKNHKTNAYPVGSFAQ